MSMLTLPPSDPFSRSPSYFSKKGWGFALVVLFHIALIVLLEQVLEHASHSEIAQVVTAQLVSEFHAPEPPKLVPPLPKLKAPPPQSEPTPSTAPLPVTTAPSTAPTITVTPAAAPLAPVIAAAPATLHVPVFKAAEVRQEMCEKPSYPQRSAERGEGGIVTLKFLISETGLVLESKVEKSSGFKRLDEAARLGLSLCKFKPATSDGKPVQDWKALNYNWQPPDN